jgi:hypothetical protein
MPCPVTGATPWPTTRFEVFVGTPFMGSNAQANLIGVDNLDDEDEDDLPHPQAIADVARAFSEAARWYQKKGFPPPNILPIINTQNGPAYRIYLCKPQENGFACGYDPATNQDNAGIYQPLCNNDPTRTRFIYLNRNKVITNLGLNELGYQTIAHELMHAIIDNTAFGTPSPCGSIHYWITESLPDAISFDIAEELWKNRYEVDTRDGAVVKRYGYRPYEEPLTESGEIITDSGGRFNLKYVTSSFWRYLADSHPDGWGVLLTKKPGAAPGLLDLSISDDRGRKSEIKWLDNGLRGKFNKGLKEMYGLFVNNIAHRIAPVKSYQGLPAEAVLEKWAEKLFGECGRIDPGVPDQTAFLYLKPLASKCLWVEPTNVNGFTQITFQAESDDPEMLKDISIGQAGSTLVVNASVGNHPGSPGKFIASWRDLPHDGSRRLLYVVSNAASNASETQARTVTLTVAKPGNTNSAWVGPLPPAPVAPRPQPPSYDGHAKRLSKQQRDTAKMIEEQMNLDKQSLNPNVSNSTMVRRRSDQPGCPEPFKYTACGPQLLITLELMPGTYISPGGANAQGGVAAQAMGGLQAMSQTSLFDTEQTMKALQARVDAIDGSAVHIAIPLKDYGFSGSIPNAAISVAMSGGRTWRAFGPPDEQGRTRLTGTVSIQEFTPMVIRGSFVAPLAEMESGGDQGPVYRSRQTVTGTFTSVAPWQNDERVHILPEPTEQLADEIANTLGVPADVIYSMKQKGTMPGGPAPAPAAAGPGSSAAGGTLSGECSCKCEMRELADDLCELFCEEEFAACEAL